MTKAEINTFIETMEEFGDIWTADQVEEVYGSSTLKKLLPIANHPTKKWQT